MKPQHQAVGHSGRFAHLELPQWFCCREKNPACRLTVMTAPHSSCNLTQAPARLQLNKEVSGRRGPRRLALGGRLGGVGGRAELRLVLALSMPSLCVPFAYRSLHCHLQLSKKKHNSPLNRIPRGFYSDRWSKTEEAIQGAFVLLKRRLLFGPMVKTRGFYSGEGGG